MLANSFPHMYNDFMKFSAYYENEKTADVYTDTNTAHIKRYTLHPAKQIFYSDEIPLFRLGEIFKSRCWDENRPDLKLQLHSIGLDEYDVYKIVRRTHGLMMQDKIWFCFEGENLTYETVGFLRDTSE